MANEIEEARGTKRQKLKGWMDEHWGELLERNREMRGSSRYEEKKDRDAEINQWYECMKRWDER